MTEYFFVLFFIQLLISFFSLVWNLENTLKRKINDSFLLLWCFPFLFKWLSLWVVYKHLKTLANPILSFYWIQKSQNQHVTHGIFFLSRCLFRFFCTHSALISFFFKSFAFFPHSIYTQHNISSTTVMFRTKWNPRIYFFEYVQKWPLVCRIAINLITPHKSPSFSNQISFFDTQNVFRFFPGRYNSFLRFYSE